MDALYAGRLVEYFKNSEVSHIFAATHTHYAPMLDDRKPHIGQFSSAGFEAYVSALKQSEFEEVDSTLCRLYRAEVDVPIYRRFDYPDNSLNRFLSSRFGFYPNEAKVIDKSIYLFEFGDEHRAHFVMVYHACHPTSRGVSCELSSDYIGAIRQAVRKRFAVNVVVFLQGCAGDIRPNLARKRVSWLPRFRLNWKFNWLPKVDSVLRLNEKYFDAVMGAVKYQDVSLEGGKVGFNIRKLKILSGEAVDTFSINLFDAIGFHFFPFEVSHLYHLEMPSLDTANFIVSCTNDTIGYLSHPSQHQAAGYEVFGSLYYMGLKEKIEVKELI
ncbi:hypothetical protein K5Q02_15125 [Pseudomonas sp. MM211]|uniref:hypothetical protein n=1 Tax=Pseudomonas sp. MM211 TaxID=2866808 RepID=UPI001CED3006|nr:hypothetical protein [Pseudomonas sp. MM211]UCJ15192.1 hypothetical protein K5Q02_15125 [Pseudomonas sp. MM211]